MRYFHRAHLASEDVLAEATRFFGGRLTPSGEAHRSRSWAGTIGHLTVHVEAEGGHYTRVTVVTDQPGESELDKLGKRFLTLLHAAEDPGHNPIGAY